MSMHSELDHVRSQDHRVRATRQASFLTVLDLSYLSYLLPIYNVSESRLSLSYALEKRCGME